MGDIETEELEIVPISMVESMTRGEINSQIATAHQFPRSLEKFKKRGIEMACIDEQTAESCLYCRPVGKGEDGKQKMAEGMSIRMAEIVGAAYGNIRVNATLLDQTERQVVARGMAIDLESNFASASEVVESTVDRNGKPYSERQRALIAKVALAKARRDATFQVVPKALARPIEMAVRQLLMGDAKSLEKRRATIMAWIKELGIDAKRVWLALDIGGPSDLGLDQIETLTGIRTAIKDNETTVEEAFPGEKVRAPGTATSYKADLEKALTEAGGSSTQAKAMLKTLTGKTFFSNVNEAEAKDALGAFRAKQAEMAKIAEGDK